MKRILVTGGAGFIGSHTVDLLLKNGKEVVVIDNLSTGKLSHLDLFNPALRFVQGDVLDEDLLQKEMAICDAVLHLAALPSVALSIEDPIQSLQVNTLGFVKVLQAIRKQVKPIRFVYASSAAVYGATAVLPCSDEIELKEAFLSPYALQKASNERYADLYSRLFGVQSLGLRYFNVYGKRQDPKSPYSGVISKFVEQYKNKLPITIFGDGHQSRDFIHVSDVAKANELALLNDCHGVMNIATGAFNTLKQLVNHIESAGGKNSQIDFYPQQAGDIFQSYGSTKKAERELQFKFEKQLEEGIKELI